MSEEVAVALSILIVEDQPDAAQSLYEVLTLLGHTARTAPNADAALREVEADVPDVVLLDIGLPGMNGWELAGKLKILPKPPVLVAVTGYGSEEHVRRSHAAGIHLHLVKPVNPATLAGLLRRIGKTRCLLTGASAESRNSKLETRN